MFAKDSKEIAEAAVLHYKPWRCRCDDNAQKIQNILVHRRPGHLREQENMTPP
jgi:hypothetical protein